MRLTKSKDDVMVSGVLAGIGEYYEIDPTLLRIGFVIIMFATPLPVIPLYIIGALIIPEAPNKEKNGKQVRKGKLGKMSKKSKKKDFKKYDTPKDQSSTHTTVKEEDWSDF